MVDFNRYDTCLWKKLISCPKDNIKKTFTLGVMKSGCNSAIIQCIMIKLAPVSTAYVLFIQYVQKISKLASLTKNKTECPVTKFRSTPLSSKIFSNLGNLTTVHKSVFSRAGIWKECSCCNT
jgi:hypothetical protein